MNCKNIEEVRTNIDRIDNEIIKLIAERGAYVKEAARFKKSADDVKASDRAERVIAGAREKAVLYGADADMVETLYREMIGRFTNAEMSEFQKQKMGR